ncbi:MAG: hypothetical protein FWC13_05375 [Oscillospiraceae bacterium]|nr:hypothetical protein [Oscillospiraceae bacterium]
MSASNVLERKVLNHFFGIKNEPPPTQVFVGLLTSDPTDEDIGLEVSGGNYERQPISFSPPEIILGKTQITNNAEVRFPVATANWGTVAYFGIYNAQSGGELYAHTPVGIPKQIENDDEAVYRPGMVIIKMD